MLKFKKLTKKQKIISISSLVIIICVIGISVFAILNQPKQDKDTAQSDIPKKQSVKPKPVEKFYSSLSGTEVASKNLVNKPVIGVMIENSPNARPQSGLAEAEVVFEAVAEGGVTRFLALYQQNNPSLIGPVRSLRSYYLDWGWGFQASIAHVGGSGDALARIRDGAYRDMDEFFNTKTFWRARDRWAPHNVYTTFENLSNLNNSKGWKNSNFEGFSFKKDSKSAQETARQIQINLSSSFYNSAYTFDGNCNCYARSQAGSPHLDREKGQISAKNIIALKIPMSLGSDRYHNVYSTIGSGSGVVFRDGTFEEITWIKQSENSPIVLKNAKGENIKLNRGSIWISSVPVPNGSISWQ